MKYRVINVLLASIISIELILLGVLLTKKFREPSIIVKKDIVSEDTSDYFTIDVPSSWTTSIERTTGDDYQNGLKRATINERIYFSSNSKTDNNMSIRISVHSRPMDCDKFSSLNTEEEAYTGELPKRLDEVIDSPIGLSMYTKEVQYIITAQAWNYPKTKVHQWITPSNNQLEQNKKKLREILSTFRPKNVTILQCPQNNSS